jgi:hypothetical protein
MSIKQNPQLKIRRKHPVLYLDSGGYSLIRTMNGLWSDAPYVKSLGRGISGQTDGTNVASPNHLILSYTLSIL